MKKIAITGHRKLANQDEVRKNIALSLQYFQTLDKDLLAISAIAVGADIIFAIVIIVPSIYAALEGVNYFGEYKKNIAISKEIEDELIKCKVKMNHEVQESEFLEEIIKLRKILELENSEWVKRLFGFHFGPAL